MLNWGMRHGRPRTRTDHLLLSSKGQLTLAIDLDPGPPSPEPPAWDARWRRCLAYRRCRWRAPGMWPCTTRAATGHNHCALHREETP
jgi:hypothetical protein